LLVSIAPCAVTFLLIIFDDSCSRANSVIP
jgi:hypothetical protein